MVFYKQTSKISPGRKQQALKILKETTRNENDCNTGLQDRIVTSQHSESLSELLSESFSLEEKFGNNQQSKEKYTGKMKDYNCKGQGKRLNQADTSNITK